MTQANKFKEKNGLNKMFIPVIFVNSKARDMSDSHKLGKQWKTERVDTTQPITRDKKANCSTLKTGYK